MGRVGLLPNACYMYWLRLKIGVDAAKSVIMKMQVKARKMAEHGKCYAKKLSRGFRHFFVPGVSMGRVGLLPNSCYMHWPRLKIGGDAAKSVRMRMQVK